MEQSSPITHCQPSAGCIFNMSVYFFYVCLFPEGQFSCHIPASVFYSLPMILFLVYFPKIFNCIIYSESRSPAWGKRHWKVESNIKITPFPQMGKGNYFDRKNYKALENKVNHCGRTPEVDKWKCGNVSTTSAICFLCCQFLHTSPLLFSFSLPYLSPHPVLQPRLRFLLVFSFSLFVSRFLSPSLPLSK